MTKLCAIMCILMIIGCGNTVKPPVFDKTPATQPVKSMNPTKFFEYILTQYYSNVRDYTCTFVKQEFINGEYTKEQQIEVKFRETPRSIAMKWAKGADLIDNATYNPDVDKENAVVKLSGVLRLLVPYHINSPINGYYARLISRKSISQFGFANNIKSVLKTNNKKQNDPSFSFIYAGTAQINCEFTFLFKRFLTNSNLFIFVSQKSLLPIYIVEYNNDGKMLGKYAYKNIKLNVGLTNKDFIIR